MLALRRLQIIDLVLCVDVGDFLGSSLVVMHSSLYIQVVPVRSSRIVVGWKLRLNVHHVDLFLVCYIVLRWCFNEDHLTIIFLLLRWVKLIINIWFEITFLYEADALFLRAFTRQESLIWKLKLLLYITLILWNFSSVLRIWCKITGCRNFNNWIFPNIRDVCYLLILRLCINDALLLICSNQLCMFTHVLLRMLWNL